jgi:hypothetical protein
VAHPHVADDHHYRDGHRPERDVECALGLGVTLARRRDDEAVLVD